MIDTAGRVIAISMRSPVETDLEPAGSEQATTRPAVSVIVPFAGSKTEAEKAVVALERLRIRPGDQVIVVDNSPGEPRPDGIAEWVSAPDLMSSYYARNVGAEHARNDWLLFLDADCEPEPDLLDRYFDTPIGEGVGAIAGGVRPASMDTRAARY